MVQFAIGPGYPLYDYGYVCKIRRLVQCINFYFPVNRNCVSLLQTTVLDGRTGRPLLERPVISGGAVQSSPLTLFLEASDKPSSTPKSLFLYWTLDCAGHEQQIEQLVRTSAASLSQLRFAAAFGAGVSLSSADSCALRFNSTSVARAHILGAAQSLPGYQLYDSGNILYLILVRT